MSAISAANSPDSQAIASFLRANAPASTTAAPTDAAKPDTATGADDEKATVIDLTDRAKTILAQAQTDQVAADSLQAFIDARRGGKTDNTAHKSGADAKSSALSITETYQRLTLSVVPTVDPNALAPVDPKISFHNSLQVGGFSISVSADAGTGAFKAQLFGPNGIQWDDQRFGRNGEVAGSRAPLGVTVSSAQTAGNVEYITITQNSASAQNVTASSDAGSVSASSLSAHSEQTTFAIDFNTGSISMVDSSLTLTAGSVSSFSRLA